MPTPTWKYAENTFESSTQNSWKLMNKVATDHLAKLKPQSGAADADLVACRDRVTAALAVFSDAWSKWQNVDASYGSKTDVMQALIADLSATRIRQWDIAIQGTFLDDTPEYAEILPAGRGPFQSGAIEDRVQAVKTLGERLAKFAQFAALKATVEDFYGKLKGARDTQKGREGERDALSNTAETARVALAAALYANVGRLMEKHATEPHRIEDYFDLSLIRQASASPTAPVPVPPVDPPAPAATSAPAAARASATPVTDLAPRLAGNGSREHATV